MTYGLKVSFLSVHDFCFIDLFRIDLLFVTDMIIEMNSSTQLFFWRSHFIYWVVKAKPYISQGNISPTKEKYNKLQ